MYHYTDLHIHYSIEANRNFSENFCGIAQHTASLWAAKFLELNIFRISEI